MCVSGSRLHYFLIWNVYYDFLGMVVLPIKGWDVIFFLFLLWKIFGKGGQSASCRWQPAAILNPALLQTSAGNHTVCTGVFSEGCFMILVFPLFLLLQPFKARVVLDNSIEYNRKTECKTVYWVNLNSWKWTLQGVAFLAWTFPFWLCALWKKNWISPVH